ncbi:hypothetical protein BCR44DRAFT_1153361 [Catenaria anguillulae PL171]|uniref:Uncharacterized protein n=1 Tax=Catenaria anguillulae PL171 TaxID=765915 RepID=A0A1Y2HIK8_9FUNG|nr:hypothetical protein BCR44DRAFT_1153361 [Catenaria anguillulae PL171]
MTIRRLRGCTCMRPCKRCPIWQTWCPCRVCRSASLRPPWPTFAHVSRLPPHASTASFKKLSGAKPSWTTTRRFCATMPCAPSAKRQTRLLLCCAARRWAVKHPRRPVRAAFPRHCRSHLPRHLQKRHRRATAADQQTGQDLGGHPVPRCSGWQGRRWRPPGWG